MNDIDFNKIKPARFISMTEAVQKYRQPGLKIKWKGMNEKVISATIVRPYSSFDLFVRDDGADHDSMIYIERLYSIETDHEVLLLKKESWE